jgi:hypothetical protein
VATEKELKEQIEKLQAAYSSLLAEAMGQQGRITKMKKGIRKMADKYKTLHTHEMQLSHRVMDLERIIREQRLEKERMKKG